jgi:phage-related protein/predicted XRE-type DNA-binding protein
MEENEKNPLRFYRTSSGAEPIRDWLKELDPEDRKSVWIDLMRAQCRRPIVMPLCRPMGDGLWEVRTELPSRKIARVLFCVHKGRLVALHGFIKKTQKTPDDELKKARKRQKVRNMSDQPIGSNLDDFLQEEGLFEETQAQAIKEVIAWQLGQAMKDKGISKARMATLLKTSRTQVNRLLDPENDITLSTLQRAAALVGRKVRIDLVAENGG